MTGIHTVPLVQHLTRLLPVRIRRWGKSLLVPEYRRDLRVREELQRLKALPRYQAATTNLLGAPLETPDGASFVEMYGEIFEQAIYAFSARNPVPYIIDGGANIGLTILYFKKLYPQCQIVGFEPDQAIFNILQKNINASTLDGVKLVCRALSATEQPLRFKTEGSYAGRLARSEDEGEDRVETTRLRRFLQRPVDLLKLNIEGAETEVLVDCQDLLMNVENVALEYHSFASEAQTLDRILSLLSKAGFRWHIRPSRSAPQPLLKREVLLGMDLQLYLFAFRS
jgi:FkbM family methyltransferase